MRTVDRLTTRGSLLGPVAWVGLGLFEPFCSIYSSVVVKIVCRLREKCFGRS